MFVAIVLALNLAALIAGGLWLRRLQAQARTLCAELDALAPELAQKPVAAELAEVGPQPTITIRILNPLELAATRSWFGDKLGSLTPALISRIVHERTVADLARQMAEHGVKAQVQLVRA